MKILNLVWNEDQGADVAETFFIGDDNSPTVPDMLVQVKEKLQGFEDCCSRDIFSIQTNTQNAEEKYNEVYELLKKNGYTILDVPEITVHLSR